MSHDIIELLNLEYIEHLVSDISLRKDGQNVYVYITLKRETKKLCSICGSDKQYVHDYQTKHITHSITTIGKCTIIYKARRYRCKTCQKVYYEPNPFSSAYESISMYTKTLILEHLLDHTHTFTSAAKLYHTSIQSTINIFDTLVQPKRLRLPTYISMDEFYLSQKSKYKYACMMIDFEKNKVIDVYVTRHKHYLTSQFSRISKQERDQVKGFTIDMWDSYKEVINLAFPKALVAVDSFHVIKILNEAMKQIRLEVMRKHNIKTSHLESNDIYYYMLKKFHYFFLRDYDGIYSGHILIPKLNTAWKKEDILHYLLSIDDLLYEAYKLKEAYRTFNKSATYENCDDDLDLMIKSFRHFKHPAFRSFGKTLLKWRQEIKNSFIRVNGKRLSNGKIEKMNSKVKTIIKSANGIKSFDRLKRRIMFTMNQDIPIKYKK
jgi:transposase